MADRTAPADLPPLRTVVIGNKEWRQGWFTEKEVRELLAEARQNALKEAAAICDEEGREWDSDALQTFKNYAAHSGQRIRALLPNT